MRRKECLGQDGANVKKRSSKSVALIMAAVLAVGGAVGGTVAWLISKTDTVVNTFTYGDIDLKLEETLTDEDGNPVDEEGNPIEEGEEPIKTTEGNKYAMIPGEDYLKDPTVTVLAGNEACWLFVKLEENDGVNKDAEGEEIATNEFNDYLTYTVADGWTPLLDESGNEVKGIYFRYVGEDTDGNEVAYEVLKDNKISVKREVTKEMLNALDNNGVNAETATYPNLSITAYAVQYSGFETEVSEEADDPTAEQINTAALKAWRAVEE